MLRSSFLKRYFHPNSCVSIKKSKLPPRPKLTDEMESEFEEKFLHGGRGPGGQKINKCNSKVQLKHIPSGIVVECQETRSRTQNRHIAREKMAFKIAQWKNGGKPIEREVAVLAWEKQSKRSKERKSKEKHSLHKELRRAEELKRIKEEEEVLTQLAQP